MEKRPVDVEIIKRLEKAQFINLDVSVRAIVDSISGANVDYDEWEICPPLHIIFPPRRYDLGFMDAVKTLNESVNSLTNAIEKQVGTKVQ
jgi:predicted RNA methylase